MSNESKAYDMLIVGAGFAGLYQLYCARNAGLRAHVVEAGDGVGGTWFWNRYPGARCDVESLDYSYSFSKELQQEWVWTERYAPQAEILSYINHVADRFDLRRDIQLETRVISAKYVDSTTRWTVTTNTGDVFDAQYVVLATGGLSIPQAPKLKGLDKFKGNWYHSADWPREGVDFRGKRVALIGTGSSGVQMTPVIAAQAVQLTVFQRTANYSVPAQNEPLSPEVLAEAKANYDERRRLGREAVSGQFLNANPYNAFEMTEEERMASLEHRWRGAGGGFRMLRAFNDMMRDPKSNKVVSDFAKAKYRSIVKDPVTAELLCPKDDVPFGTKRLCVDSNYYETFNRDNVKLVSIKTHPIVEATETGLRTTEQEYEFDIIAFATGFDALTGAVLAIDIRGANGISIQDKWANGPVGYLGMAVAGFPNLFAITGPGSPSVLTNVVHSIETHVDWIMGLLARSKEKGSHRIEATSDAENGWVSYCAAEADKTLYPTVNSWYTGANIEGKPRVFMAFVSGVPAYRKIIEDIAAKDYEGFAMTK
jgi:cyclohexanone monooxygenase